MARLMVVMVVVMVAVLMFILVLVMRLYTSDRQARVTVCCERARPQVFLNFPRKARKPAVLHGKSANCVHHCQPRLQEEGGFIIFVQMLASTWRWCFTATTFRLCLTLAGLRAAEGFVLP